MSAVSPARARFRRALAAIAAFGVIFVGLVPASAAYAIGDVTARVIDIDNNPLTDQMVIEYPGGSTVGVTPDSNGDLQYGSLPAGDYKLRTWNMSRYPVWEHPFTVVDFQTTALGNIHVPQLASVAGSVPAALGGQVSVNLYRWWGTSWGLVNVVPYPTAPDGTFRIWSTDATASYTLEFVPDDSIPYMTTYLGGGASLPSAPGLGVSFTFGAIDTTTLVPMTTPISSGIVSGTVTGLGEGPLEGAYVVADDLDGDELAETQTDDVGAFTLKVPLDVELTVRAYADGWQYEFYSNAYDPADAETETLTAVNSTWSNVDFELIAENEVDFHIVFDNGGTLEPYEANTWLYYDSGSGYGPVPFDVDWEDDTASFDYLTPGNYRVGLQLVDESGWIPFSTTNVVPGTIPGDASACYYEFEITGSTVELVFVLTAEPASAACVDAPWLDGAPAPGEVTGEVTNIGDVTGPATATLFVVDNHGDSFEVVSTTVNPTTGEFVLPGVYVDGEYFVGIETPHNDPHIDTLFGATSSIPLWWIDDEHLDGINVDAGDDYNVGAVALPGARVLSGIVTSDGNPVEDACVLLIDENDDVIQCSPSDSTGQYWLKAPVSTNEPPTALRYWILAESDLGLPTFWGEDPIQGDAIVVTGGGVDPFSYDIEILTVPSLVFGIATQLDDADAPEPIEDGVAHLYRKSGSSWVAVESFPMISDDDEGVSTFGFPAELLDFFLAEPEDLDDFDDIFAALFQVESLPVGDYRIWFSQDGEWLPIASYEMEQASLFEGYLDDASVTEEGCYLEFSNAEIGTWTDFELVIDSDIDLDCVPPVPSDGGGPTTPKPPAKPPAGTTGNNQQTDTPDDGSLEEGADEGESEGEAPGTVVPTNPTPTPTPDPTADGDSDAQGPDLTWLWWTGGILLLIIIAGGTVLVIRRP